MLRVFSNARSVVKGRGGGAYKQQKGWPPPTPALPRQEPRPPWCTGASHAEATAHGRPSSDSSPGSGPGARRTATGAGSARLGTPRQSSVCGNVTRPSSTASGGKGTPTSTTAGFRPRRSRRLRCRNILWGALRPSGRPLDEESRRRSTAGGLAKVRAGPAPRQGVVHRQMLRALENRNGGMHRRSREHRRMQLALPSPTTTEANAGRSGRRGCCFKAAAVPSQGSSWLAERGAADAARLIRARVA